MQIGAAIATGDAVQRHQGVVLRGGQAQQQVFLLAIGTDELGVAEYFIGPQAAFATIAGLAPEQQLRALRLQRFTRSGKRGTGGVLGGQLIGNRRGVPTGGGLPFVTQLAADLADRAHRVDAFLLFGGAVVDDL